jgi:hypothetical protein
MISRLHSVVFRFHRTCLAGAWSLVLVSCSDRHEPEPTLIPRDVVPGEITVNGTVFPTKDVIQIKTGPNAQMVGDDGAVFRTITQASGVVDLIYPNGDVIRVSPDGWFLAIPAPAVPAALTSPQSP